MKKVGLETDLPRKDCQYYNIYGRTIFSGQVGEKACFLTTFIGGIIYMIERKVYRFNNFCKELKITNYQKEHRFNDLLEWLTNFYDYDFIPGGQGAAHNINIKEIYGEYESLPRKAPKQEELTKEKLKDYEDYTIAALGTEFKPNSKTKIAREAIQDFGRKKYHHTNTEAVSKRFIKKPFDKYGETNNIWYWVWYSTYQKVEPEVEEDWHRILKEEEIAEEEASNAFYKAAEGEDISEELNRYQKAKNRMVAKYGDFIVRVREWKTRFVLKPQSKP